MHFGFSYIGLIFLVMLIVPNLIWTKFLPEHYEMYVGNEKNWMLIFERVGEVTVSVIVVIFSDFNPQSLSPWLVWLVCAVGLMVLYEIFWVRYFLSARTMLDFYSSLLGIPVAGATLPVAAFGLLAVYGCNPILGAAVVVLGIGHIGIHWNHRKEVYEQQ